jgi:hypothetical protein
MTKNSDNTIRDRHSGLLFDLDNAEKGRRGLTMAVCRECVSILKQFEKNHSPDLYTNLREAEFKSEHECDTTGCFGKATHKYTFDNSKGTEVYIDYRREDQDSGLIFDTENAVYDENYSEFTVPICEVCADQVNPGSLGKGYPESDYICGVVGCSKQAKYTFTFEDTSGKMNRKSAQEAFMQGKPVRRVDWDTSFHLLRTEDGIAQSRSYNNIIMNNDLAYILFTKEEEGQWEIYKPISLADTSDLFKRVYVSDEADTDLTHASIKVLVAIAGGGIKKYVCAPSREAYNRGGYVVELYKYAYKCDKGE